MLLVRQCRTIIFGLIDVAISLRDTALPSRQAKSATCYSNVLLHACVVLILVEGSAFAQGDFIPVPQLSSVFPQGLQIGTSTEVILTGEHLDGPATLLFSNPSIVSKPKRDDHGKPIANAFVIHVSNDTAEDAVDVCLQGKFGLSNPRQFILGKLPEVNPLKAGIERDKATEVVIDSTINTGTVVGTRSWFKFHANASQRLFVQIDTPDSRAEPVITITEPTGRVVLRGRAPTKSFEFTTEREGDYFIEIHDLLHRGGDEFRYRLSVSTHSIDTKNVDSMPTVQLTKVERDRINKVAAELGDVFPHDLVLPAPLELPFEFIALFPPGGQAATFLFSAKAHEVLWIDVWSHRLGHATDVSLVVDKIQSSVDGKLIPVFVAEASDMEHSASATGFDLDSRDGTLRFEASEDGLYRISLRDGFNTSLDSPRLPYRLCIRTTSPNFELIAVPDQGPRSRPLPISAYLLPPTLRRGGVASIRVFVKRQDDFSGDITLDAEGLPEGVVCLGAVLGNGDECASLTFYASEDAQPWSGWVGIQGKAILERQEITRIARTGTPIWNVKDTRQDRFQARRTHAIGLSVVADEAPMLLEPEIAGMIEAKPKDKISLKLKVTRRGGYDGIVSVRPFVLGDQDKSVRSDHSIPKGVDSVSIELDLSKFDVKPGEHSFVIHGYADKYKYVKNVELDPSAKPKDVSFAVFSKPIRLKILADTEKK